MSFLIRYNFFQANFVESITACQCIKRILIATGFDNEASFGILKESVLNELYKSVDENIIESFECQHKEIYKEMYRKQNQFNLLPGHKVQILQLATGQSKKQNAMKSDDDLFSINAGFFSPIMREIVHSAKSNHNKHPNARRYSDLLTDFSMYNYIMAGKACYEVLSANLPMPKAGTLRNFIFISFNTF